MALLITLALMVCPEGPCESVRVGCWEYLTADCSIDVFYRWDALEIGDRPAHCDGPGCLPLEWEACDLVRRVATDCEC